MNTEPRRGYDPLFTPGELVNMSARQVSKAHDKALYTIRFSRSVFSVYQLALSISEATKGNVSQAKREHRLQLLADMLHDMDSKVAMRELLPALTTCIKTSGNIGKQRKKKVLEQARVLIVAAFDKK